MSESVYESVYKYMSIKHVIDCLEHGIYAGNPRDFNDPYEEKDLRYIDQYRVACLGSSHRNMLMWAHYGKHQQCCIEFSVPEDTVNLLTIQKSISKNLKLEKNPLKMFYYKGKEWEYESEKRAVCDTRKYDETLEKIGDNYYLRAIPKAVYFGLRVDFKKDEAQDLLKYIKEFNLSHHETKIEVNLCKISDGGRSAIALDKQFDYEREIDYDRRKEREGEIIIIAKR